MNQPKLTMKSFEQAVFDGDINGPRGVISTFGEGSHKPSLKERKVRRSEAGMAIGHVLDLQDPAVVEWAETKDSCGQLVIDFE